MTVGFLASVRGNELSPVTAVKRADTTVIQVRGLYDLRKLRIQAENHVWTDCLDYKMLSALFPSLTNCVLSVFSRERQRGQRLIILESKIGPQRRQSNPVSSSTTIIRHASPRWCCLAAASSAPRPQIVLYTARKVGPSGNGQPRSQQRLYVLLSSRAAVSGMA